MAISSGNLPKMGDVRQRKEVASQGIAAPSMASHAGTPYPHPGMTPVGDKQRAHPGTGKQGSSASDVDHGHTWGKGC